MIVVTAPTANIGHRLVADLLAAGETLRLIARDPSKLSIEIRDRAEVVTGSHGDAAVVDRAFEGADAVFWLVPPSPSLTLEQAYSDFTRPAADAIRRHAVRHVVSVTALGRGTPWQEKAGLVTASIRMDDMLMAAGASFRGLAMPSFMDNAARQAASIRERGEMTGPIHADRKAPATATRDMAAAAARLLADRSWSGQHDVPLLGPEDLSPQDMATIAGEVLGRDIRYRQVSWDAFEARFRSQGFSESFVRGYVDMYRAKDEGMDNVAERDASSHTPTTFRQWCEDELKPLLIG